MGRIGNQMFHYAVYVALRRHRNDVYLDLSRYASDNERRFELEEVFGVKPRIYKKPAALRWMESCVSLLSRKGERNRVLARFAALLKRIYGRVEFSYYRQYTHIDDNSFRDLSSLASVKNLILEGYWQSSAYFSCCYQELRKAYSFIDFCDTQTTELVSEIRSCVSVSINFRRGDYYSNEEYRKIWGDICTIEYYRKAIAYMDEHLSFPEYYVITDDPDWARGLSLIKNMRNAKIVSRHSANDWRDMILMSQCRHNIIANSSYSWWASWLNENPDKIVVAPSRWVQESSQAAAKLKRIHEENWILIDP
jgi:hypothetical protein